MQIMGHSLGAGTAAVLTFVIRTQFAHIIPSERVSCIGVATPACLSYNLAAAAAPYITSVVLEVTLSERNPQCNP